MWKTLRSKVFAFLSLLMLISLVGVGVSFLITQTLNSQVTEINFRFFPIQKNLVQLSSDTLLLKREMERSLGIQFWNNSLWKPKRIPEWVLQVQQATLDRFKKNSSDSMAWKDWRSRMDSNNLELRQIADQLFLSLLNQQRSEASTLYHQWINRIDLFQKEVDWAKQHIENETQDSFREIQTQVNHLKLALQILLLVVISVALIMLWMGERALRPIDHLRKIVKQITDRGALTHEEKAVLPETSLFNKDEVSELAREFHTMATSLLEREKMIESQKSRLEEQNRMLLQMSELQKRLQEVEHLAGIGRLSAQVAHEIGNPLHSIGLEAELAIDLIQEKMEGQNPAQSSRSIHLKQSLQSILASVERLKKITQNYLKLSKGVLIKTPVDLEEVIESVLATYANSIQQADIKIHWHYSSTEQGRQKSMVLADASLLEQAFGNLIRNSIQALQAKKAGVRRIEIRMAPVQNGHHRVQVFDNGSGIKKEDQANVFKPFFTTKADGTGLGLSFVRKVFLDLGGQFQLLDSTSEGTLFEGALPLIENGTLFPLEALHEDSHR